MKKNILYVFLSILVLTFIFTMSFPLSENDIYGKYANKNFQQPICCVEAPHQPDTLILYKVVILKVTILEVEIINWVVVLKQTLKFITKILEKMSFLGRTLKTNYLASQE